MSSQKRTASRASTANKKVYHNLKGAYIIPAENGDKMIQGLVELPIKYSQLVGPMIDAMQKAFRGDITVTIDPNKQSPPPVAPPRPEPKADMKVEKPDPK